MSVFSYPKLLHRRTESPPQYTQYRKFKPFLQKEFGRTCVYCRAVDSVAPQTVFGVDHYRPKSKFPLEVANYRNLYYCCSACNTNKAAHWPNPELVDTETIPNPCDFVMTKHLRFRGPEVVAHSPCGEFTLEFLDLNEPKVVKFREHVIHMVEVLSREYEFAVEMLEKLDRKVRNGLPEPTALQLRSEVLAEIARIEGALQLYYGTAPCE